MSDITSFFEKDYSPGFFYGKKHRKELNEIFVNTIKQKKQSPIILDIGFGELRELNLIEDFFTPRRLVGVDIFQKKMKSLSRELKDIPNISVINGDINKLDFEENYFDYVLSFKTFCFATDPQKVLETIKHILKRKGQVILSFDIFDETKSENYSKYKAKNIPFYTPKKDEFYNTVKQMGFKNISLEKNSKEQLILFAEKK